MADAAAAAAALQRQLDGVRSMADKQLASMYHSIQTLQEVGYHRFIKQLNLQSLAYSWPPHIMDVATADLTDIERQALDDGTVAGLTTLLHIRNAYVIITAKCDGHQVEHLLEGCAESRPRVALDCIREFFHPDTTAGRTNSYKTFNNATMANTHTNIVEWAAIVRKNAKYLRQVGGQADDGAQLSVLLSGLLPEFDKIKLLLDETDGLTLDAAIRRLTNHARSNNLLEVSKGKGTAPPGAKVFFGDSNNKQPCRQWAARSCRFGRFCRFSHDAPGGSLAAITDQQPGPKRVRRPGPDDQKRGTQPVPPAVSPPSTRETAAPATYTAREVPTAAVFMAAESGRLLCYTCRSTTHNSPQCPLGHDTKDLLGNPPPSVMMAISPDQPSSTTSTFFSWLVFILAACSSTAYTAQGGITRLVSMPGVKNLMLIVLLGLVMSMTQASANVVHVSAKCYFNHSDGQLDTTLEWVTDTGSNRFITNDEKDFVPGSVRLVNTRVMVGSGTVISPCEGTVMIRCHASNKLIACTHTLLLSDCDKKLMPARPFLQKGCTLSLSKNKGVVLLDADQELIMDGKEVDGLYYYNVSTAHPECYIPPSEKEEHVNSASLFGLPLSGKISAVGDEFVRKLTEAHHALGHMHFDTIRKLFGLKRGENPDCATCAIAKQKKSQLSVHLYSRATKVNHRMHIDIGYTEGSGNPFQLYVDDYTRVSHLDLLDSKSDTLPKWEELKRILENRHFPNKVAFVKTDNEFVYTSNAWIEHCRAEGVEHEFSARYRHDQNGVVERAMGVVGTTFRCLMIQGGAPDSDIPNALVHANVIRNNTPTEANKGLTPKEKEAGMKLGINARLLKGPLFCLIYAHIYAEEPGRVKHGPRGVACVYLGYDDRNDQFKVKEWMTGSIYYSGDGVFHPRIFPYRASPAITAEWIKEMDLLSPRIPVSTDNPAPHSMPTGPRRSDRQHGYIYSGGKDLREIPDVDHVLPDYARALFVHSFGPDPNDWPEALASRFAQDWLLASLKEKASFQQHKVYALAPRAEAEAAGKKIYKPRPVFKIKINPPTATNPEATLEKFKFRQTIAAYTKSMTQGIDFAEKRASTVRWESTLVQFAIAVMFDLEIVLLDICTFFLYGVLTDLVYMEQPPEWVNPRYPADQYVCRLLRSMYGLPQASHCAQMKLKTTLTADKKFTQTAADDCVFVSGKPGDTDYVATGTHVDDLLGIGTPKGVDKLTATLKTEFEITVKKDPTMVTGVQIERNRAAKWLKLHQAAYVDAILAEFGQTECNPADTPMDAATTTKFMQLPVASASDVDLFVLAAYRTLVGMLIWLYKTRPDMMFTINLLARYLHNATQAHLNLARGRPLRYLKGTRSYGLVFAPGKSSEWKLSGSGDADLAGDLASSRSTIGFYNKIGEYGTVAYACSLERKIASSTQQAETYALASMAKSTVWLRQLTHEMGWSPENATDQSTDNRGVFLQSSKQVNHATAKHFRIAQAFIRNLQDDGIIRVSTVDTKDNGADMFTKGSIPKDSFFKHRLRVMGPQDAPAE